MVSDPFENKTLPQNWHWGLSRELDSTYTYFIYHEEWEGKLTWDGSKHTVQFRRKISDDEYSEIKYSDEFNTSEAAFNYAKQKAVELTSN